MQNIPVDAGVKMQGELKDLIFLELGLSLKRYKDENASLKEMVACLQLERDNMLQEIESLKSKIKNQASPVVVDTPAVTKKHDFPESQASGSSTPVKNIKPENVGMDTFSIPTFSLNISADDEPVKTAGVEQGLNIPPEYMLTNEEMTKIQTLHAISEGDDNVYWDNRKLNLHRSDIEPLFTSDCSSDKLMDVWSYFMALDHEDIVNKTSIPKAHIFQGNLWSYMRSFPSGAQKAMENELEIIYNTGVRYALFPITTPGVGTSRLHQYSTASHWTLFVYDTVASSWSFYNSMLPRSKTSKDLYFEEALHLASFVHLIIQNSPIKTAKELTTKKVADYAQQKSGSLDCGFIVMMHIEAYVKGEVTKKGVVSNNEVIQFKSRLYFEEALHLASFVHHIIQNSPIKTAKELTTKKVSDCAQQKSGSLDCGFIVMMHIEAYVKGEVTKKGVVSNNEVIQFKSRFLKRLINSPHFVDHKEMEFLRNLQKEYEASETTSDVVRAIEKEQIDLSTPSDFK